MRVRIELEVRSTVEDARWAVRELDELAGSPEDAISLEGVKPSDVIEALLSGGWNPSYQITSESMEDH